MQFDQVRYDELLNKKKKTARETMEFKRLTEEKRSRDINEDFKPSLVDAPNTKAALSYVNVYDIRDNPYQPRVHLKEGEVEDLVESISAVGLQQPIGVAEKGGALMLVAGQKRLLAFRALNAKEKEQGLKEYEMKYLTIPAMVGRGQEAIDLLAGALVENTGRENPFIVDTANALAEHYRLMNEKAGRELSRNEYIELAGKSFGVRSRAEIIKYLAVAELPRELQERAIALEVNALAPLYYISKKECSGEEKLRLLEAVGEGKIAVRDLERGAKESVESILSQKSPKDAQGSFLEEQPDADEFEVVFDDETATVGDEGEGIDAQETNDDEALGYDDPDKKEITTIEKKSEEQQVAPDAALKKIVKIINGCDDKEQLLNLLQGFIDGLLPAQGDSL